MTALTIRDAHDFFDGADAVAKREKEIAERILREIARSPVAS